MLTCSIIDAQASSYLNKLPEALSSEDRILVVDPMLATGGACTRLKCSLTGLDGHCLVHAVPVAQRGLKEQHPPKTHTVAGTSACAAVLHRQDLQGATAK